MIKYKFIHQTREYDTFNDVFTQSCCRTMYAVIEFLVGEDRECALVPVLWLVENNTQCYWPRTKTEDHFTKLVKSKAAYEKTWPKFAIHKVLHTGGDYWNVELFFTIVYGLNVSIILIFTWIRVTTIYFDHIVHL